MKTGRSRRIVKLGVETLEQRRLLAGVPMITEFMAQNNGFHEDGDCGAPDWIEIKNVGDEAIDLKGYRLTDQPSNPARWVFPSVTVEPSAHLLVFASGQVENDYVDAAGNLHTNFKLSANGEYLALSSNWPPYWTKPLFGRRSSSDFCARPPICPDRVELRFQENDESASSRLTFNQPLPFLA